MLKKRKLIHLNPPGITKPPAMKKLIILPALILLSAYSYSQSVTVQTKLYLQGAYAGSGTMNTYINTAGYLPLSQPYTGSTWNYAGTEQLSSIPANMVDWVMLELRDQQNTVLGRRAAILTTNGSVLDTNLNTTVTFPGISHGNYYLVIDHRNHLPVMSGSAISLPNTTAWDFSDTLNFQPIGGGRLALWDLGNNVFGMIVGDINKDGTIKYSGPGNDRSLIIQRILNVSGSTSITTTVSGYYP